MNRFFIVTLMSVVNFAFASVAFAEVVHVTAENSPLRLDDTTVGSCSDGIVFDLPEGVVEFNTTAAPTMPISGSGLVSKTSSAAWTMSTANTTFQGSWAISNGTVTVTAPNVFGSTASGVGGVHVAPGASLIFDCSSTYQMKYRRVYLAGTGDGTNPALLLKKGISLPMVALKGNATVKIASGCDVWSFTQATGAGLGGGVRGSLQTNGFTLDLYTDIAYYILSTSWTGDGLVRLHSSKAFTLREDSVVLPATAGGFEVDSATSWTWYNRPAIQYSPLKIACNLGMTLSWQGNYIEGYTSNNCNWAGPVTLDPTVKPTVSFSAYTYNFPGHQISFSGGLRGDGDLLVGGTASDSSCIRLLLDGTNSAYLGSLTIRGAFSGAHMRVGRHDIVSDYSKITVDGSRIGLIVDDPADPADARWPKTSIFELANLATFTNNSGLHSRATVPAYAEKGFLALGCEELDGPYELAASEFNVVTNADVGWACDGGEFRITGSSDKPLRVGAFSGGVLNLTGAGSLRLEGRSLASSTCNSDPAGEIRISDGMFVTQGSGSIQLGSWLDSNTLGITVPRGRLVISNATLVTEAGGSISDKLLQVGSYGLGELQIDSGAVVTAFVNSAYQYGGSSYFCQGAIRQNGGEVALHSGSGIGYSYYGSYALAGGSIRLLGGFNVGVRSYGVLSVCGGDLFMNAAGCVFGLGTANGGHGLVHVKAGEVRLTGTTYTHLGGGNWCEGHIVLDGPDAVYETPYLRLTCNNRTDGVTPSTITLKDGVLLSTGFVQRYNNIDHSQYPAQTEFPSIVNFNGGAWRARTSITEIFKSENGTGVNFDKVSRVAVYEDGAKLDTNGYDCRTAVPLVGITEGGITSVAWSSDAEFSGEPYVEVSGNGWGAFIVADYDAATRRVTGLRIVSPGWGYTTASATVRSSATGAGIVCACTVGTIVPGGLTKLGGGTLTLNATNTWQRWTRVEGGTLKAACDKAIPDGTALTLSNGGVLDLNNVLEPTFTGLDGTGGSVVNGTVQLTGDMEISAKRFIDRVTTEVTGPVDFTAVTSVTLTDTELLDAAAEELRGLYLIKGANLTFGATKPAILGVPTGWQMSWRPDGLRLSHPKGLAIIVR